MNFEAILSRIAKLDASDRYEIKNYVIAASAERSPTEDVPDEHAPLRRQEERVPRIHGKAAVHPLVIIIRLLSSISRNYLSEGQPFPSSVHVRSNSFKINVLALSASDERGRHK